MLKNDFEGKVIKAYTWYDPKIHLKPKKEIDKCSVLFVHTAFISYFSLTITLCLFEFDYFMIFMWAYTWILFIQLFPQTRKLAIVLNIVICFPIFLILMVQMKSDVVKERRRQNETAFRKRQK